MNATSGSLRALAFLVHAGDLSRAKLRNNYDVRPKNCVTDLVGLADVTKSLVQSTCFLRR